MQRYLITFCVLRMKYILLSKNIFWARSTLDLSYRVHLRNYTHCFVVLYLLWLNYQLFMNQFISLSHILSYSWVSLEQFYYCCSGSEIIQGDNCKIKWYKKHSNHNVVWTVCNRFGLYIHDDVPFQPQTKQQSDFMIPWNHVGFPWIFKSYTYNY